MIFFEYVKINKLIKKKEKKKPLLKLVINTLSLDQMKFFMNLLVLELETFFFFF